MELKAGFSLLGALNDPDFYNTRISFSTTLLEIIYRIRCFRFLLTLYRRHFARFGCQNPIFRHVLSITIDALFLHVGFARGLGNRLSKTTGKAAGAGRIISVLSFSYFCFILCLRMFLLYFINHVRLLEVKDATLRTIFVAGSITATTSYSPTPPDNGMYNVSR